MDIFSVLTTASLPVILITLCLLAMSIYSWGISAYRYRKNKKEYRNLQSISERLEESLSIETVEQLETSLFKRLADTSGGEKFYALLGYIIKNNGDDATVKNKVLLLRKTHLSNFINTITSGISHVSVITYLAPYVGLLGTVLGILDVFHNLGGLSVVTLNTVAAPLSEALIVTALGLCVAIPSYALHSLLKNQSKSNYEVLDKALDTLITFKFNGELR